MSREWCPNCKTTFSTTAGPNEKEGYFISDVMVEKLEGDMEEENFSLLSWCRNHLPDATQCPWCQTITLV